MFEQDDLEKYLRDLAQGHESPYNPADWADMQARLQQAGLAAVAPPSMGARVLQVIRKVSVWSVVVLLLGIGRQGTDTPPQASLAYETKASAPISKPFAEQKSTIKTDVQAQKNALPTPYLAYQRGAKEKRTDKGLYTTGHIGQITTQKQLQNLINTPAALENATQKEEKKPTETRAVPDVVIPLPIASIEKVGKQTFAPNIPIEALQPVGFSTVEPFMQKEITDIAPLPTEGEKAKMPAEGYQNFDVYVGEALNTNLAFKIGTERWYSIVNIGYQYAGNGRWGFGYGVGKELKHTPRRMVNAEFLCSYIKTNGSSNGLSLLTQAKLLENYRLSPRFVLFASLNANALTSDFRGEDLASSIGLPDWALLRTTIDGINAKFWLGAQVGVSIRVGK